MREVRALIPAAGHGKRLAGITGGGCKELVKIGSLTMIEHALKMVLESGISEVGIVIRSDKEEIRTTLEDFRKRHPEYRSQLTFIYQEDPRGVADAMWLAREFSSASSLAVIMPDNLLLSERPALAQMMEQYAKVRGNIIGVIEITPDEAARWGSVGLISLGRDPDNGFLKVRSFTPKQAGVLNLTGPPPYYKGTIGVIYRPGWEKLIHNLIPNHEGEIDDTDLVLTLVKEGRLFAAVFEGRAFDLGQPRGLAAAAKAWEHSVNHAI